LPTGVTLRDVREQLFAAAERILLRDGPGALTSRSVTTEAGVAKGVLHKHFADFDAFLADLVHDRVAGLPGHAPTAGSGTVAGNLADTVTWLFGSVALVMVQLITARDELRRRLHAAGMTGVPILSGATTMIADYLNAERALGRVAAGADTEMVALTLIGAGHLLFAGRDGVPPPPGEVHRMVANALPGSAEVDQVQDQSGDRGTALG
jgi:AcrR family transcriptional regulator